MAQQNLNVGTTANDGTGDTLRASQIKVQSNFDELYARPDFTDAPSDGNTYGRKDGTWEQVTGGSGTTPTLQEVVVQGNEIINTAGNLKLVLDKEDNGIFLYELVSSVWENRGYYNSQGFTLGGFDGTPTFDLNIYTGTLTIYQGTDIIQFSPTSATKNGVEFATEDFALKRDGSNANSDVDLGVYRIKASEIVTQKGGDTAKSMALKGNNLTAEHVAEWQDMDYIGVADISQIPTLLSELSEDSTHRVVTDAEKSTWNSKQNALSYTPFKFIQASQTAHTGTTAETILATATISGGTYNSNDVMKAIFKATKTATTSNVTMRLRINTTNSLSGATQIAILTFTTANLYAKMKRDFDLNGGNLYAYSFASSLASDDTNVNTLASSTAYNTANTLYFFWTLQLGTSGDSVIPNLANLTN